METSHPIVRPDYKLADSLWAPAGAIFLTGTQALIRLMLMQRQRDAAAGLDTRGFISGYRGSPLGMVDQAVWKAGRKFEEAGLRFLPAINEELGATAVLGTQRVEADPERTCAGVFALWYGKGPGVDRAGDALKHGNAYGASPHGGVEAETCFHANRDQVEGVGKPPPDSQLSQAHAAAQPVVGEQNARRGCGDDRDGRP